jgi:hypothetical protein
MLDITLCSGHRCPLKNQCYRFRAKAYGRQDGFGSAPYDHTTASCSEFYDIAQLAPTDAQIRTNAYHAWQSRGRPEGTADADWHQAREQLQAAYEDRLTPDA